MLKSEKSTKKVESRKVDKKESRNVGMQKSKKIKKQKVTNQGNRNQSGQFKSSRAI